MFLVIKRTVSKRKNKETDEQTNKGSLQRTNYSKRTNKQENFILFQNARGEYHKGYYRCTGEANLSQLFKHWYCLMYLKKVN